MNSNSISIAASPTQLINQVSEITTSQAAVGQYEQFDEWNLHSKSANNLMRVDHTYFQINTKITNDANLAQINENQNENLNWNSVNSMMFKYQNDTPSAYFCIQTNLQKNALSLILLANVKSELRSCDISFKNTGSWNLLCYQFTHMLSWPFQLAQQYQFLLENSLASCAKYTKFDTLNPKHIYFSTADTLQNQLNLNSNFFIYQTNKRASLFQKHPACNQFFNNRLNNSMIFINNSNENKLLSHLIGTNFELTRECEYETLDDLMPNDVDSTTLKSSTEWFDTICTRLESRIYRFLYSSVKKKLIFDSLDNHSNVIDILETQILNSSTIYEQIAAHQFLSHTSSTSSIVDVEVISNHTIWADHIKTNIYRTIDCLIELYNDEIFAHETSESTTTESTSDDDVTEHVLDEDNLQMHHYWSIKFLFDSLSSLTTLDSAISKIHLKNETQQPLNTIVQLTDNISSENNECQSTFAAFADILFNSRKIKMPYFFSHSNLRYWSSMVFNSKWFEYLLLNSINGSILNTFWDQQLMGASSNLIAALPLRQVIIQSKFMYKQFKRSSVRLSPIFTTRLIRFIEHISNQRVFLQINSNAIEWFSSFEMSQLSLWTRKFGFYKRLFPSIYVDEMLQVFWLALKLRDSEFLSEWIRRSMLKISSWDHRLFMSYVRNVLRLLVVTQQIYPLARGVKLVLRGKISVAGNARTRTILIRLGFTANSTITNRIHYSFRTVGTFTGVLGLHLSLIY